MKANGEVKKCKACGIDHPVSYYYAHAKGCLFTECKSCINERNKRYQKRNREKINKYNARLLQTSDKARASHSRRNKINAKKDREALKESYISSRLKARGLQVNEELIALQREVLKLSRFIAESKPMKVPKEILPLGIKRCTRCFNAKELRQYNKNARTKDGIHTRCAICEREYQRQFNLKKRTKANNHE